MGWRITVQPRRRRPAPASTETLTGLMISSGHSQPDRPLEANSRIHHICETPALDSNALAGILVNYSYTGRNLNGYEETVRVFSARDAYIWTSSKLPEGATLLA